jgi:hypothetical protein
MYGLALGRQCFPGRESFVIGCSLIRDVFVLIVDADNYKIKIKDLALFVRNVLLSPP